VTSPPLVKRTRATLRKAEFGFLGVTVVTFIQTPRLNGDECIFGRFLIVLKEYAKTGALFFLPMRFRGFLINCRNVGIKINSSKRIKEYQNGQLVSTLKPNKKLPDKKQLSNLFLNGKPGKQPKQKRYWHRQDREKTAHKKHHEH